MSLQRVNITIKIIYGERGTLMDIRKAKDNLIKMEDQIVLIAICTNI